MALLMLAQCTKTTSPPANQQSGGTGNSGSIHNYSDLIPNPIASFRYTAILSNYHVPAAFSFTSTSSHASSVEWDFGDFSAHDNSKNPTHTYTFQGNYRVVLKAFNQHKMSSDTQYVTVLNGTYTKFTIDSIRAQAWAGPIPNTVIFKILDSTQVWQSENFSIAAISGADSIISRSYLFANPHTVIHFLSGFRIQVWENYLRAPSNPETPRNGHSPSGPPKSRPFYEIYEEITSPFFFVGYPTTLQTPGLSETSALPFTVYITWQ